MHADGSCAAEQGRKNERKIIAKKNILCKSGVNKKAVLANFNSYQTRRDNKLKMNY